VLKKLRFECFDLKEVVLGMIDWIIGGLIVGLTLYIIVRNIIKLKRGESTCCGETSCPMYRKKCNCNSVIK